MPKTTSTPKTGIGAKWPTSVSPSSTTAQNMQTARQTAMIMRRLWRSATDPVTRMSASEGANCISPIRPSMKGSPVRSYICQPTATLTICIPTPYTNRETKKRA